MFTEASVISPSLSPNTEASDVLLALKTIISPWEWKRGKSLVRSEQWFRRYFPKYEVVLFNSGRSALLAILKAFGIGSGDEVLVQAFTCVAVPNSVLWAGAKPVYVDIDGTLNLDPWEALQKLSLKTKAIIVQHTFGIPAKLDELKEFAQKHQLILIEDCAHSLGASYKGQKVGTFGQATFFSFGRDKVVSSVFGGAAIIKSNLKSQILNLKKYQKTLPYPSFFWIFQQLLHPIAFSFIIASYNILIGKIILVVLQRLRLLSFPVYPEEKQAERPADFPARYPNALASLLIKQLSKLDRYNAQRRQVAESYREQLNNLPKLKLASEIEGSIYLRFPLFVEQPQVWSGKTKQQGILLGNWYHNVIDPTGVDFERIGYEGGSCPKAEQAARSIINLPTRVSEKQAQKVIRAFM